MSKCTDCIIRDNKDDDDDGVQVANYQQHYDSLLLDAGGPAGPAAGPAAGGDDELESVNLLLDDSSHVTHRLSFGSVSTCIVWFSCNSTHLFVVYVSVCQTSQPAPADVSVPAYLKAGVVYFAA